MKYIWLSLVVILLSACSDVPPDFYAASADAQATQLAAQAALRATAAAIQDEHAAATISAAKTQGAVQAEIDLLQVRIQSTKDAQALELERARATDQAAIARSTQIQAEVLARQTQAARDVQATTNAQAARATQTALAVQVERDTAAARRAEQFADFWAGFKTVVAVVIMCLMVGLATYMTFQIFVWWVNWRDRRMRMFETRNGTLVWIDPNDNLQPEILGVPSAVARKSLPSRSWGVPDLNLVSDLPAVRSITPSGSVLASRPDPHRPQPTITIQAIQLLQAAVEISGPEASTIPGWRDLKWSSERWQRVIGGLAAAGAVVAQPGVGTTITHEYETLNNLLYAVEMRELIVRPAPLPQMEVAE